MQIEFKLPVFNIFQTPQGLQNLLVSGPLVFDQKNSYALGKISRKINFETYNFAQDLLTMSYVDLIKQFR